VKADVADIDPRPQRHTERLNAAVEVLVINSVFIVPHSRARVSHFVTHKPNSVVAGIGFELAGGRTSPGHDCRLHLHGRAHR
jgi:hypothetical protein